MRFSVITITKNNSDGFQKTKQSVESQNFSDFEWIVIDGDAMPDRGRYDAMNKGIAKAQGDYLIFMNAGDIFADQDVLTRLSPVKADFIYGDAIVNKRVKKAKKVSAINGGMITSHQAMIYNRKCLVQLEYDESYIIAADYKFTLQFLKQVKNSVYCGFPVCIFESGGLSERQATLARQEEMRIRKEMGIASTCPAFRQYMAAVVKRLSPRLFMWMRHFIMR